MIAGRFTLLWFFFLSILIFRIYPGLMRVRLILYGSSMEQNTKCESVWAGKKEGKGSGIEVLPVVWLCAICKRHTERFSLIKLHCSLPTPLCSCTNETNLFSASSDLSDFSEDVAARKWEQAESQSDYLLWDHSRSGSLSKGFSLHLACYYYYFRSVF